MSIHKARTFVRSLIMGALIVTATWIAQAAPTSEQGKAADTALATTDNDVRVIQVQQGESQPAMNQRFGSVTGTVSYLERRALTPNAVFTVQLVQLSRTGVRTAVLSEQRITNPGQVPIPFMLWYNRGAINASNRYAVEASISEGGTVVWRNTTQYPVLTQGYPSHVTLELVLSSSGTGTTPTGVPRIIAGNRVVAFAPGHQPYRTGNTWMLPVRPVLDAAGVRFTYARGVLSVTNEAVRLTVPVPGRTVTVSDGSRRTLTTNIVMRNGVLYAPVAFIEMATLSEAQYNQYVNSYTFVKRPV